MDNDRALAILQSFHDFCKLHGLTLEQDANFIFKDGHFQIKPETADYTLFNRVPETRPMKASWSIGGMVQLGPKSETAPSKGPYR